MATATPKAPTAGCIAGKWPIRVNPDDVRYVFFQDPADDSWHRLEWEHAAGLGTPFSAEAARYARRLAARPDRWPDTGQALGELLARWDQGMVTGRRERRMAVRLAAERAALPDPAAADGEQIAGPAGPGTQPPAEAAARRPDVTAMTKTRRRSSTRPATVTSTPTRSRSSSERDAL